ncbi:MAG: hypothetical protein ACRD4X_01920 [Candidatus Acidiferrales bacterium]
MGLSTQKQHAVDEAIRKAIGPKRAVVKKLGSRYTSKKFSNYQQWLCDDGCTALYNLDNDTVKVSEKPSAMHFNRYKQAQAREEKALARKAAKAEKSAKPKAEPKAEKKVAKAAAAKG